MQIIFAADAPRQHGTPVGGLAVIARFRAELYLHCAQCVSVRFPPAPNHCTALWHGPDSLRQPRLGAWYYQAKTTPSREIAHSANATGWPDAAILAFCPPSSPAVRQVRINALHAGPLAAMPWMDPGIWNRRGVQVGAFKLPQKRLEFQTAGRSLKSCGIKSCCHKSCRHKSCSSKSCGVEFEFAVFFWRPDLN